MRSETVTAALLPPGARADLAVARRVERAVSELGRLAREATLSVTIEIGRVIVTTLYDGDLAAWRARGRKETALRALAARRDLPFSASSLYRALSLFELMTRLGAGASTWKHVGASHLRLLLGLPAPVQADLVDAAERGRWTVVRLDQEAQKHRVRRARGGRSRLPEYVRSIRRLRQLIAAHALDGLEGVDDLGAAQRRELLETVTQIKRRVVLLESVLQRAGRSARSRSAA